MHVLFVFYVYFTISIMERRVLNMSKIYIEVPKKTDMITGKVYHVERRKIIYGSLQSCLKRVITCKTNRNHYG